MKTENIKIQPNIQLVTLLKHPTHKCSKRYKG